MTDGNETLPERLTGSGGLLLRRWSLADAHQLSAAVAESQEHLRPWMAWAAEEPLTIAQRRELIIGFERDWRDGGDGIHPRYTRRGLATAAARVLTDGALALSRITHVEIHHDKANVASAGVPRKLGFSLVAEVPREIEAPSEIGIECQWRMERQQWLSDGAL